MPTERTAALVVALLASLLGPSGAAAISCPAGSHPIDETLPTGGRWEMCWELRPEEGVVFSDVHYEAPGEASRRVLKEAALAQIHMVYDDDRARLHLLTEQGLGGFNLVDLTPERCPDGALLAQGNKDVLCQREEARGYVYKYYNERVHGDWLELFSLSRAGGLTWIARWRFYDDGSIEPSLGSTGSIPAHGSADHGWPVGPADTPAVGWITTAWWRLDFDIGTSGADDLVERFEVASAAAGTEQITSIQLIANESAEDLDALLKRSWRVRDLSTTNADGHAVSYHLEPLEVGHRYVAASGETWADFDLAVTRHDACERFASQNDVTTGCGSADLASFVDGQSANGADVVLWYRVSQHRAPSDEDHPYLATRWQGFLVVPRDWSADNPFSRAPLDPVVDQARAAGPER